jgi:hypothetical protein
MVRIEHGLRIPSHKQQEIAMEPLLQSETQQPQFIYVQVPMQNSLQQNPPYFAPQPFFLAPQYIPQEHTTQ